MKRSLLFITLIVFVVTGCAPAIQVPTPTATLLLATDTPQPTATSTPTETPVPTPTASPTPDFSVVKFDKYYSIGTTTMVIVYALNGVRGEFHATGKDIYMYECKYDPDNADKLLCQGAYQGLGREIIFKLYEVSRVDPILINNILIEPLYPPTPEGMTCEIEPLWVLPLHGTYGCYAVTCYLNGGYYGGTTDTCIQPWLWPVP